MILLASLAVGLVAYLAVGLLTGYLPRIGTRVQVPRRGRVERQTWLLQAGTELSVAQFVVGSLAAGAVAFALVAAITGSPVVAIVPAAALGFLPRAYFGHRRARRLSELQQAWPDGIRHIIGGIQSGMSLNQSIASLATNGPEPLRLAFARFAVVARMVGVPAALEVVKGQLSDSTSDRVIEVLLLAHERGGRIVTEVLRDLGEATSKDLKTMEEIASDRLEPKINSRAVFALPWFVLVMLCASAGPFRQFYKTAAGVVVILIAAAISLLGIWIVERLSRDPMEERVFGSPRAPR
ncbi:MAG: tight adherence protein [Actinomycetota bacterium]|nr:tight adherence protein [Actinomycetota bacterium]